MGFYDYLLKLFPVPATRENWQVTQGHGYRTCRTYFIFPSHSICPDCNCTIFSTVMNLKSVSSIDSHFQVCGLTFLSLRPSGLQEGQGNSLDVQITCTVSRRCGCLGDAVVWMQYHHVWIMVDADLVAELGGCGL